MIDSADLDAKLDRAQQDGAAGQPVEGKSDSGPRPAGPPDSRRKGGNLGRFAAVAVFSASAAWFVAFSGIRQASDVAAGRPLQGMDPPAMAMKMVPTGPAAGGSPLPVWDGGAGTGAAGERDASQAAGKAALVGQADGLVPYPRQDGRPEAVPAVPAVPSQEGRLQRAPGKGLRRDAGFSGIVDLGKDSRPGKGNLRTVVMGVSRAKNEEPSLCINPILLTVQRMLGLPVPQEEELKLAEHALMPEPGAVAFGRLPGNVSRAALTIKFVGNRDGRYLYRLTSTGTRPSITYVASMHAETWKVNLLPGGSIFINSKTPLSGDDLIVGAK